ncbi:uncharacterized protein LOC129780469 [Toxorhynchites rutilus septentrionalis]|uniref:uncharacterized protein LOC129780469 n=1 Tax=Toxorhynchites rutilus septentrionalis TaxID=329112 RepID=UPI00247896A2|nr:uncharacterized protein LOC129780469 [Toxorhynchites rutilus septentrionalis]
MSSLAITVSFLVNLWFASFCGVRAAMYEIAINSFEPNSKTDPAFMDYGTLRVAKKSRNLFVIAGEFEFFTNMDDSTKIVYEIFYGDNSKPLLSGETGFCESLNHDTKVMRRLRELSNLPGTGVCPFPKGKYNINKYELDDSQLPLAIPAGKYTLSVVMIVENEVKAGYKLYSTVS